MNREVDIDKLMELCLDTVLERYRIGDIRSDSAREIRKNTGDRWARKCRKRNSKGKFKKDSIAYELPD